MKHNLFWMTSNTIRLLKELTFRKKLRNKLNNYGKQSQLTENGDEHALLAPHTYCTYVLKLTLCYHF